MKTLIEGRRDSLIRAAALTLGVTVVAFVTYHTRGLRGDDGLIYARYVRNFLAGRGLVYNPGERWNAVSSPLYIWLLVGAGALGHDIPTTAHLVGGLAMAATVYLLVYHFFPPRYPALVGAGAGILYATANMPYQVFGMETAVLVLLLTGMLVAYRLGCWTLFAVLTGLAGATRGEAVFLAGPLYLGVWSRTRKLPWRLALVSLLVMSPVFLFNLGYYGHVLPTSLAAKVAQGHSGLWKEVGLGFWGYMLFDFMKFYPNLFSLGAVILLSLLAFLSGREAQPAWWIGLFAALLATFYALLRVPAYGWYVVPFVWAVCLLVPMGIASVDRLVAERARHARSGVLAACVVAFSVVLASQVRGLAHLPVGPYGYYFRAAAWLNRNVRPASSLGVAEVGHLGWYTNLKIVDIVGVVSPGNAQDLARKDVDAWLGRYHPDYILVHTYHDWWVEFGAIHALMRNEYGIVEGFSEPGLVLLGPPKTDVPSGSLLGRPFEYTREVREGAFRAGESRRGLLIAAGYEHAFDVQPQPDQVFVAYIGSPEGRPGVDAIPTGGTAVAGVSSGSQRAAEVFRQQIQPGEWEKVWFPLPAHCPSPCRLILRSEASAAQGEARAGPVVWAEPRVVPLGSLSPSTRAKSLSANVGAPTR